MMKKFSPFFERKEHELYIDGCSAAELAKQYGTPLYVLSESTLDQTLTEIKEEFVDQYDNVLPLYASKALSTTYMYQKVASYGLGVDVVSAGEMYIALRSGVDPNMIYFHGSNKSRLEIEFALSHQVTNFIIDNFYEIELLDELCQQFNVTANAMVRVVPQVDAGAHHYIKTGNVDTKFGFSTHDKTYLRAIDQIKKTKTLEFIGIHCHVGSQIMERKPFLDTASTMMKYVKEIQKRLKLDVQQLNIGGGYGIIYEQKSTPLPFKDIIHGIMRILDEKCEQYQLQRPRILIEPGRSIVGNAGVTLYTVGAIKDIPNIRKYVSIDGGMADNIRPSLYDAKYHIELVNDQNRLERELVTIAGKCCESGDILIEDVLLPTLQSNDLVAVFSTGAYNYSMSSNYNQLFKPAMVVANKGTSKEVINRQTFADLIANEVG